MNIITLSWNYIRNKPLNTLLNTLLLGFGVGIIIFLLLIYNQLGSKFENNLKGVDAVVGAKGSALQLILSSVYQADNPVGNIPAQDTLMFARVPFVRKMIPLSMGDNYRQFRIVGTNHNYPAFYNLALEEGRLWSKSLEVTVGAIVAQKLNLKIGDTFFGAHGLAEDEADTVEIHDNAAYKVVGIFKPSQTIIDRLILTSLESYWDVHAEPEEGEESEEKEHQEEDGESDPEYQEETHQEDEKKDESEDENTDLPTPPIGGYGMPPPTTSDSKNITAILLHYSRLEDEKVSPMAVVMVSKMVENNERLQLARPADQIAKFLDQIGFGRQIVNYFALVIVLIATLSIFIALYNALKERQYDLAIMRALGASKFKLFSQMIVEGLVLALLGVIFGFTLGHIAVELVGWNLSQSSPFTFTGWYILQEEWWLLAFVLGVGLISAIIPATLIYRIDISRILAQ